MSNAAQTAWDHGVAEPDRVAIRGTGAPWTYGRLREHAAAVASHLRDAGVRPDDRVLLVAPSVPEFAGAYYGIHAAGAVAVTANTMSTRPELEYVGGDASVSMILGWHEVTPAPAEAAAALGVPYRVLNPDLAGFAHDAPLAAPEPRAPGDNAVILYTSGTTGQPKGAQLTHGNLVACAEIFAEVFEVAPEDRMGTALPLFHVFGQAVVMATLLHARASLSLLPRFDADDLLALLRRDRLTMMAGVPTMWNALLHAPTAESEKEDFATLRLAISGGAAMPAEVMNALEERFGCVILEGYGLSETTGAATFNGLQRERKPSCVGIALPRCAVEVRGDDGAEVPTGEIGEVHIKGPTVMSGYWGRPEATAEVLGDDGWLKTGDLGTADADGDIRIVDRKKDLVIRGGYNVYPREVEEVLYEHPDVVEVAVVGVPDEHLGEEVAAVLALVPGATFDATAFRAWAKQRLSAYKVPHVFQIVDALPKSPTGKILKRAIDTDMLRATAGRASSPAAAEGPRRPAPAGTEVVLAERRDAVLVLTLNRPARLNAWSDALESRYFELLDEAQDDPEVRAIVVTGAGRGFCAGADMDDLSAVDDIEPILLARGRPRHFPLTVRKPLIAAINGPAAGLGLVEALYCDVRFCARDAKLTTAFARLGLIAEYGISWLLPRLIGPSAALDLLLSGRVVLGEEAHRLGLIDRLADRTTVLDDAIAYASGLAEQCSPTSMATIKAQVQADLERTFAEAALAADVEMVASFRRPDVAAGIAGYTERRSPSFPPLSPRSAAAAVGGRDDA
jgi:long-chain acyl-CoA synthetase